LDAALTEFYQACGISPSATCDDATFLRRVWLDVAGARATGRVRKFLATAPGGKRGAMIDELRLRTRQSALMDRYDRSRPFEPARVQRADRAERDVVENRTTRSWRSCPAKGAATRAGR
jgi:hypothetical protein